MRHNILGVGDHFQIHKVLERTGTCRGWVTTSRSLGCLKVHVRYCTRTYLLQYSNIYVNSVHIFIGAGPITCCLSLLMFASGAPSRPLGHGLHAVERLLIDCESLGMDGLNYSNTVRLLASGFTKDEALGGREWHAGTLPHNGQS